MKKLISVFLLFIALLIGTAPVIAVHLCKKDIKPSLSLLNQKSTTSCCKKESTTSTPSDKLNLIIDSDYKCCENHNFHVVVDAFEFNYSFNFLKLINENNSNIDNYLISTFNSSKKNILPSIFTHKYPPQGLFKQQVDLLSYICTYRI